MNPFCEAILKLCTMFLCMKELLLLAQRTSNHARVEAVWCWSGCEQIPHIQGQRRSPRKMVGEAKLCLESNSVQPRDGQRA